MKKVAYLIKDIKQYGYFIAYCINHDITVWRTYFVENYNRFYTIDWQEKRCYYGSRDFYEECGYEIIEPKFSFDKFGDVVLNEGE